MAGSVSIIAGTGGIIGQDIDATIKRQMHDGAPALGEDLSLMVKMVTPVLSGSLLMDISFDTSEIYGPDDIVLVYAESTEQQAYWNRIYVPYVEGDPLGLPTYTNDPRLIFLGTAEGAGLDLVKTWAMLNVNIAISLCLIGAGVPI
jgi:hypothetical protein